MKHVDKGASLALHVVAKQSRLPLHSTAGNLILALDEQVALRPQNSHTFSDSGINEVMSIFDAESIGYSVRLV